jgi:hypothetical protein
VLKGQLFIEKNISVQILTDNGIIVSAPQIVQSGFLIIHIPTIAERIHRAQRSSHLASLADQITPCILNIFYHLRTIRVNQHNHISLQVVDIEVIDIVIGDHAGLPLRIIEEYEEENGWYFVWCDDEPVFVLGSDIQFN